MNIIIPKLQLRRRCYRVVRALAIDTKLSSFTVRPSNEVPIQAPVESQGKAESVSGFTVKQILGVSKTQQYLAVPKNGDSTRLVKAQLNQRTTTERVVDSCNDAVSYFLPKGYPHSVTPGYSQFAAGQMASMILSSAAGVLSMQSLLCAIGIGSSESLPLAATLNWVIKVSGYTIYRLLGTFEMSSA